MPVFTFYRKLLPHSVPASGSLSFAVISRLSRSLLLPLSVVTLFQFDFDVLMRRFSELNLMAGKDKAKVGASSVVLSTQCLCGTAAYFLLVPVALLLLPPPLSLPVSVVPRHTQVPQRFDSRNALIPATL